VGDRNGMFGGMDDCVRALWPERCSLAHGDEAMKTMTCSTGFLDVAADLLAGVPALAGIVRRSPSPTKFEIVVPNDETCSVVKSLLVIDPFKVLVGNMEGECLEFLSYQQ